VAWVGGMAISPCLFASNDSTRCCPRLNMLVWLDGSLICGNCPCRWEPFQKTRQPYCSSPTGSESAMYPCHQALAIAGCNPAWVESWWGKKSVFGSLMFKSDDHSSMLVVSSACWTAMTSFGWWAMRWIKGSIQYTSAVDFHWLYCISISRVLFQKEKECHEDLRVPLHRFETSSLWYCNQCPLD
jgi:hypothetical protein